GRFPQSTPYALEAPLARSRGLLHSVQAAGPGRVPHPSGDPGRRTAGRGEPTGAVAAVRGRRHPRRPLRATAVARASATGTNQRACARGINQLNIRPCALDQDGYRRLVAGASCSDCARHLVALGALEMRVVQLQTENEVLQRELDEALKLVELQKADIDRYEKALKEHRPPNCPERAPDDQLQLAMERVLLAHGAGLDLDDSDDENESDGTATGEASPRPKERKPRRHNHGRRPLDMANLPTK